MPHDLTTKSTKSQNHLIGTFLAALLLVGAPLVAIAPTASAHTCTVEKGESTENSCNVECKKGEDHEHRVTHYHENGMADDESHVHFECSSKAEKEEDDEECSTPKILGTCIIDGSGVTPPVIPIAPLDPCTFRLVVKPSEWSSPSTPGAPATEIPC